MKSFVFYLILIALFLAGTKLVCRQQQYTRSIQALVQTEPTIIKDRPATDDATLYSSSTGLHQPHQGVPVRRARIIPSPNGPGVGRYHRRIIGRELTSAESKDDTRNETYPFSGHYVYAPH